MREGAPFAADQHIAQQLRDRHPHLRRRGACQRKTVGAIVKTVGVIIKTVGAIVKTVASSSR